MHIHILGICGTFMGGVALLARERGITVSGSDANVYPPMSTQLADAGIELYDGYAPGNIAASVDQVVVGNVMTRGNPAIEHILNTGLSYTSGPQWLKDNILADRWVLAVAGTHGKTSTSSMLAWILEYADLSPGFLIGGVPGNFGVSARLGTTPFFVVEADEYDTAFFDKRSKFVHYRPQTLILNNLEFDHADIFPDLAAIQRQFHHLVRIVPGNGLIVTNRQEPALEEVLALGCWTPVEGVSVRGEAGSDWSAQLDGDGSRFEVLLHGESSSELRWDQIGEHNVHNALSAIAAARHAGVPVQVAIDALKSFKGVKRRMERRGVCAGVTVYDDFAHHPTAIRTTLAGLRAQNRDARIVAVLEPRSNTMRMGTHQDSLVDSLQVADRIWLLRPDDIDWDIDQIASECGGRARVAASVEAIIAGVVGEARSGDQVLVMSNGGFGGIHDRLLKALAERSAETA